MKKQVVLYSGIDTWECRMCIFSEKVKTEKVFEDIYICHKNRMKFSEEKCVDLTTNEQLMKNIEKENKKIKPDG